MRDTGALEHRQGLLCRRGCKEQSFGYKVRSESAISGTGVLHVTITAMLLVVDDDTST
jgi:hypothetical protein